MVMPLGASAPDFNLPDAHGKIHKLSDYKTATATLVVFACNHCPYVVHIRKGLADFAKEYLSKNVAIIAINSNDVSKYPDDSPEKMISFAKESQWDFPYLFDETQSVARSYHAACTPDFFLFDAQHKLVYRGQFDDARPGNASPVTGSDLRRAADALLAGNPPVENQKPSMGCNIKWKI